MTDKQIKLRKEKESNGRIRANLLFDEFLKKSLSFDSIQYCIGVTGNYPKKANIRLYNSHQSYKNRPVYCFEIGYPNITNDSCFYSLLDKLKDYLN